VKQNITMKKTVLFVLSLFLFTASFAQVSIRIGQHAPATWNPSLRSNFSSTSEANYYAQEIIDVVGLKPNFTVQAANVENAAAVTYNGQRYVLYNPNFINALVQRTGNKWAAISVLAHEIGHHLNGHTVSGTGSQPAIELEADEFSGFVLRKMGASLADAQAAMQVLASQTASRTHPAQYDRLASIEKGWIRANGSTPSRDVVNVPQPRQQDPVPQQRQHDRANGRRAGNSPVLSSRDVIGTVQFNSEPNVRYYVTTQYDVVKMNRNNRSVAVGKLARQNSQAYPYRLYDNQTRLMVNSRGAILNTRGQQVGTLTAYRG
jgi:hypothetical protein